MSSAGGPVIITFESELAAARRSYEAFVAEVTKPLTIPFSAAGSAGAGSSQRSSGGQPGNMSPAFDGIAAARGITVLQDLFAKARADMERPIRVSIDTAQAQGEIQRLSASIQSLRGGNQPPPGSPSSPLGSSGGGSPFWPFIPPSSSPPSAPAAGGGALPFTAPPPPPPSSPSPSALAPFVAPFTAPPAAAPASMTGAQFLAAIPRSEREDNAAGTIFGAGRGERAGIASQYARHIPAGSTYLAQGAEAIAFRAPNQGDVYRALVNEEFDTFEPRPQHPLVLQAKSFVRNAQGQGGVERLPYVDTNLTGIEKVQLARKAAAAGLEFDANSGNMGRDPLTGQTYIIDPGGLRVGQPERWTSEHARGWASVGAIEPPSHQEIQAEQARLRQYAKYVPSRLVPPPPPPSTAFPSLDPNAFSNPAFLADLKAAQEADARQSGGPSSIEQLRDFYGSGAKTKLIDAGDLRAYIRQSNRPIAGSSRKVLDIADVEAREKGQGAFTNFLNEAEAKNPWEGTYVESVVNPRLAKFLERRGYVSDKTEPPSYYRMNQPSPAAPEQSAIESERQIVRSNNHVQRVSANRVPGSGPPNWQWGNVSAAGGGGGGGPLAIAAGGGGGGGPLAIAAGGGGGGGNALPPQFINIPPGNPPPNIPNGGGPGLTDLQLAQARAANRAGNNSGWMRPAYGILIASELTKTIEEGRRFRIDYDMALSPIDRSTVAQKYREQVIGSVPVAGIVGSWISEYVGNVGEMAIGAATLDKRRILENRGSLFGGATLQQTLEAQRAAVEGQKDVEAAGSRNEASALTQLSIRQSRRESENIAGSIGFERKINSIGIEYENFVDQRRTKYENMLQQANAEVNPFERARQLAGAKSFRENSADQQREMLASIPIAITEANRVMNIHADTMGFGLGAQNEALSMTLAASDPRVGAILGRQNNIRRGAEQEAWSIFNDPNLAESRKGTLMQQALRGGALQEEAFSRAFVRNFHTEELDSINQQNISGPGTTDPSEIMQKSADDMAELVDLMRKVAGGDLTAIRTAMERLLTQ